MSEEKKSLNFLEQIIEEKLEIERESVIQTSDTGEFLRTSTNAERKKKAARIKQDYAKQRDVTKEQGAAALADKERLAVQYKKIQFWQNHSLYCDKKSGRRSSNH